MVNIKNIEYELKKELARLNTLIGAWHNVKIATKKDGAVFQNIGKNFINAEYGRSKYSIDPTHYELTIHTHTYEYNIGYISDEIRAFHFGGYGQPDTLKTVDELKNDIKNQIIHLENRRATVADQLNNFGAISTGIMDKYNELVNALNPGGNNAVIYELFMDRLQSEHFYKA